MNANTPRALLLTLADTGFAFVNAYQLRALLEQVGSLQDWDEFRMSWADLSVDTYLAAHGHHRRRRHAVYAIAENFNVIRLEHQPHYQSLSYNQLQGGIERWFEPIETNAGQSSSMQTILQFAARLFNSLSNAIDTWRVEAHQFRIEANLDAPGFPTPEGIHRDGVDYVLVLLVNRQNITSGTTTIHNPDGALLGSFTLRDTFDAALLDDSRVLHGVTMIQPLDPHLPAWRDVLVVTFKRMQAT